MPRTGKRLVPDPSYEQRYCAFIDILGFGELIGKLDVGGTPAHTLRELLTKIHNPPPTQGASSPRADFRAQSISDAGALSAAIVPSGLGAIIHSIDQLAVDLLTQGFFIRGALVKDLLYHGDKTVFGTALLRAYNLERSVVRFPRVMVTREVVEDIRAIDETTYNQLLRHSDDGPLFIHVLRAIEMAVLPLKLGTQETIHRRIDNTIFGGKLLPYADISTQLQRRFDEATDNPRHFEKVKWFASYWNEHVRLWDIDGLNRVKGPGLDLRAAVWASDYFRQRAWAAFLALSRRFVFDSFRFVVSAPNRPASFTSMLRIVVRKYAALRLLRPTVPSLTSVSRSRARTIASLRTSHEGYQRDCCRGRLSRRWFR